MRSGLAAGLMGIGGILLSFGAVIVVLALFARQGGGDTRLQLPAMTKVALGSLVVGGVMFGAGFLMNRIGGNSNQSTSDRSAA